MSILITWNLVEQYLVIGPCFFLVKKLFFLISRLLILQKCFDLHMEIVGILVFYSVS
jgi:hypothetical protein